MTEREQRGLEDPINKTAEQLLSRHPAFLAHERFIRARLAELAHHAYVEGQHAAYGALRTSTEIADDLGYRRVTILKHSRRHDIGWRIGRDILYRPEDVERLRAIVGQPPGRKPMGTADDRA